MKYTREDLIQICLDAVVPCEKWQDRDSYCAQLEIQSIYQGLSAGLDFHIGIESNEETIWINFKKPLTEQLDKIYTFNLNIDSREDYFKKCDPNYETEMFDGKGIDWQSSYYGGYMPTRERLNEVNGDDWY